MFDVSFGVKGSYIYVIGFESLLHWWDQDGHTKK
jgi:hypothetical protein